MRQIRLWSAQMRVSPGQVKWSYPWERGAELRNVQVGHQGDSETVGEHQL